MVSTKTMFSQFLEQAGITLNGDKPYDIAIRDDRLYKRLRFNISLGAGESYMDGWWDCDQLDELFFRIQRNNESEVFYEKLMGLFHSLTDAAFNLQTRLRSKEVAEKHYNLGNDLYRYMLGPSMAYTCAYWKNADNLDQAQYDKYDLICKKIKLKSGEKVLELGCGWGGFAKFAAENYGCEVVAVNISIEQVNYAKEICKHLPVEIYLCDYRDDHIYNSKDISFDKAVSIGLCEHVGYKNYSDFLKIVAKNLDPNGLFLLHTIGKNESHFYPDPWIRKYIFPNGILPSVKILAEAMENVFVLEDLHNIGADYDKTLMAWSKNFKEHWPLLKDKYGEKFYRLWNYYLLCCAGGFRARVLQLWQIVLSPKGIVGGYESVR